MSVSEKPVLSVVIAIAGDTTEPTETRHLGPCVGALKRQTGAPAMEIIVPLRSCGEVTGYVTGLARPRSRSAGEARLGGARVVS